MAIEISKLEKYKLNSCFWTYRRKYAWNILLLRCWSQFYVFFILD